MKYLTLVIFLTLMISIIAAAAEHPPLVEANGSLFSDNFSSKNALEKYQITGNASIKNGELVLSFMQGDNFVDTPVSTGKDDDYVAQCDFRVPSGIAFQADKYYLMGLFMPPGTWNEVAGMWLANFGVGDFRAEPGLPGVYQKDQNYTAIMHLKSDHTVDYFIVGEGVIDWASGETTTNETDRIMLGNLWGAATGELFIDNVKVGQAVTSGRVVNLKGKLAQTWGLLKRSQL